MTDLRVRVARKLFDLYAAHLGYADAPWFIVDTPWDSAFHQPWLDEADAVIRELGLREELRYPNRLPHYTFMPPQRTRYVTEWEADDE